MIEYMIIGAIMAINMARKTPSKPVFGQLTLTGELALDWLKTGTEIQVRKLWMGGINIASEYNLPDWAKDKGVIAMLFPMDEWSNPVLVTQKSVLRVLEAQCAEWEAKGAKCTMTRGKAEILFEENQPRMEFVRPEDGPTYAPYKVSITE